MTSVSTARLATIFVEVADTLVDEFDPVDFLHMIAQHAATLADASAAGLMLANPAGELEFMAASDESAGLIDFFRLQVLEGPCLDAFHTGEAIINVHLDSAHDRWPLFAPEATAAGFHSAHAFPLRLRSDVLGVLIVFGPSAPSAPPTGRFSRHWPTSPPSAWCRHGPSAAVRSGSGNCRAP